MNNRVSKVKRTDQNHQAQIAEVLDLLTLADSPQMAKALREANPDHPLFKTKSPTKKQQRRHSKRSRA